MPSTFRRHTWRAAAALVCAFLTATLADRPAHAAVAEGDFCVVGLGPTFWGTGGDGWLAIVTRTGAVTPIAPTTPLNDPVDCAVDPTTGDVIVVDAASLSAANDGAVHRFVVNGGASTQTTLHTGAPLVSPMGVTVDQDGTIYIADLGPTTGGANDGAIYSIPSGGALTGPLNTGGTLQNPADLDIDPRAFAGASPGINLIVLDIFGGRLDRLPIGGGTAQTVAASAGAGLSWHIEVGPYGNYFNSRTGVGYERTDRLSGTRTTITNAAPANLAYGLTIDWFTGDIVGVGLGNGVVNIPPNAGLAGAPGPSTIAAGGTLPSTFGIGVGFSPVRATGDPSAKLGMPTRRAPIPGSSPAPIGPSSSLANGDPEDEVNVFIEVTDTSSPLLIRLFDANTRNGFDGNAGAMNTATTYTLFDPAGTQLTQVAVGANARVDLDQRIATLNAGNTLTVGGAGVPITAEGLYRLRVDMTSGDDWNGIGFWVEDFHAYSYYVPLGPLHTIGTAPNLTPLDAGRLYPYFDRGCEATGSNFDADGASNPGIGFTVSSRLGDTFVLTPSGNNNHLENGFDPSPAGLASVELDYGLYELATTLSPTAAQNNIVPFRFPDFQGWNNGAGASPPLPVPAGNATPNPTPTLRTSPGPAFPQVLGAAANTFLRQYFPRYDETPGTTVGAGPARPAAPYLTHSITPIANDPPTLGAPSTYAVLVTLVNPDPVNAMTNVTISAPVPAPTLYVESGLDVSGPAQATGSGVASSSCTAPCSGTITATWASIAAGSAETLSYAVEVTPTVAGERLYVTGGPAFRGGGAAPAANAAPTPGTTANFTPAWQSGTFPRTESLGPICDLSIVEGTTTPVAVDLARFEAHAGDGAVLVEWETASEFENLGFRVYRRAPGDVDWQLVSPLILGQGSSDFSASYAFLDQGLENERAVEYLLEDIEFDGDVAFHGPIEATPQSDAGDIAAGPADYDGFAVAGSLTPDSLVVAERGATTDEGSAPDPSGATAPSGAGAAAWTFSLPPSAPNPGIGGMRVLERGARHVLVEIQVPEPVLRPVERPDGTWTQVRIPTWDGATLEPGRPELPARTFWVGGIDAAAVRVATIEAEREALALPFPVLPVPVAERSGSTLALRHAPDPAAYAERSPYPAVDGAASAPLAVAEGSRVALRVAPVRTTTGTGLLESSSRLVLRLDFVETDDPGAPVAAPAATLGAEAELPGVKVTTRGSGIVAVTGAELLAAGLAPGIDARQLEVVREGDVISSQLEGEADGFLDADDVLRFYAAGRSDRYGDEEVFFVVDAGVQALRIDAIDGSPAAVTSETFADASSSFEEQTVYLPGLLNGEDDNFVGAFVFDAPVTSTLETPALVSATSTLHVRLRGGTTWSDIPDDHHFSVHVGGSVVLDAVFDGSELYEASVAIPAALLSGPTTDVTVQPEFDSGAPFDLIYIDALTLDHRRALVMEPADAGRLEWTAESTGPTTITGLSAPEETTVWDVTFLDHPVRVVGLLDDVDRVTFVADAGRRYVAHDGGALLAAVDVASNLPSDWTAAGAGHGAEWVAIAHASLMGGAQDLADLRAAQGLSSVVIDVEDVYDEMSGGRATPVAIRDFVRAIHASWDPAPRYVVLVGDANYDYRDFLGSGSQNFVPTMLVDTRFVEAASDSWLFRLDDEDEAPDVSFGRIPARTPAELDGVVSKIESYEAAKPAGEPWRKQVLLVADDGLGASDPVEAAAYEDLLDAIELHGPTDYGITRVALTALPDSTESADANLAIRSALSDGVAVGVYAGHGGARLWADELIFGAADFDTLSNPVWPLLVVVNCLNGFFDAPNEEAFGEVALSTPERGALAVLSSTTVSDFPGQDALARALAERVLRAGERRAGDGLREAMQALAGAAGSEDALRTYVLLGDPASLLGLPPVPLAAIQGPLSASPGAVVALDGSGSTAAEGGALTFEWTIESGPVGHSSLIVASEDPARPLFAAAEAGEYRVGLVIREGAHESARATVAVTVADVPGLGCGRPGNGTPALSGIDLLYLAFPLALSKVGRRRRRRPADGR